MSACVWIVINSCFYSCCPPARLKDAYRTAKGTEMIAAIVQPGVDVKHTFNPASYFSERDRGLILGDAFEGRRRAFSIGFIGRLAPGNIPN